MLGMRFSCAAQDKFEPNSTRLPPPPPTTTHCHASENVLSIVIHNTRPKVNPIKGNPSKLHKLTLLLVLLPLSISFFGHEVLFLNLRFIQQIDIFISAHFDVMLGNLI